MMNNTDREITKKNTDFGSVLEVARKSQNYSIDDISRQLKIPVQTIIAIESNNVADLPPATFTQGYIRTYAKFLEISEENVLDIYNQAVPHDLATNLKPRSNLRHGAGSQSPLMIIVTLLLIAMGIAAAIYGSFQYYQEKADVMETELESKEPSFTGNSLDSPGENPLDIRQNARLTENDELIVQQSEPFENGETAEMTGTLEIPETGESVVDELEVDNAETAELVDEVSSLASDEPVLVKSQEVAVATDVLKIYAEQGSWMQVSDASNKRLLYNMIPKQGSKVLKGKAPFRISLGNAKTTKLVINNLAIDMSGYIRDNNTAKFTVSTKQNSVIYH